MHTLTTFSFVWPFDWVLSFYACVTEIDIVKVCNKNIVVMIQITNNVWQETAICFVSVIWRTSGMGESSKWICLHAKNVLANSIYLSFSLISLSFLLIRSTIKDTTLSHGVAPQSVYTIQINTYVEISLGTLTARIMVILDRFTWNYVSHGQLLHIHVLGELMLFWHCNWLKVK